MIHTYYPNYDRYSKPMFPKLRKKLSKLLLRLSRIILAVSAGVLLIMFLPSIIYKITGSTDDVSKLIKGSYSDQNEAVIKPSEPDPYQPRYNASLPSENRLIIRSAGIETAINEASQENFEDALRIGVWRVNDFGNPFDRKLPTILTAHRYGYLKWSIPYRLKNSFYNLPKLREGDTVEIIWQKRKYIYKVYKEEKGENISDYSADLILYTCESLNSPVRIFRYAKLLEV